MSIVNCTPHAITLTTETGDVVFAPSGALIRLSEKDVMSSPVDGFPVLSRDYEADLPAPQDGVTFLVSAMVLSAAKNAGRNDFISPDTGSGAVRDAQGRIVAVRNFIR